MVMTNPQIMFRRGTTDDLESVFELVEDAKLFMINNGIFQWDDVYPAKDDFYQDILDNNLFLAEEEKNLVGVYVISGEADEQYHNCIWNNPDETACIIHRLCVSPKYQNKGIGQRIIECIEEQAKEMKYQSIRLDVFTQNPHAINLYKKRQYEERGFADWRKGRFILMEKKLI